MNSFLGWRMMTVLAASALLAIACGPNSIREVRPDMLADVNNANQLDMKFTIGITDHGNNLGYGVTCGNDGSFVGYLTNFSTNRHSPVNLDSSLKPQFVDLVEYVNRNWNVLSQYDELPPGSDVWEATPTWSLAVYVAVEYSDDPRRRHNSTFFLPPGQPAPLELEHIVNIITTVFEPEILKGVPTAVGGSATSGSPPITDIK